MDLKQEYDKTCSEVRTLGRYGNIANVWNFLILKELRRLNDNLEIVLSNVSNEKVDRKTDAQRQVEKKYGKSIAELLQEREGKSVREIASEWGVSKSTVGNWKAMF